MSQVERGYLLERIQQWQLKARKEPDPFDRYVSFFVAYNTFYNLYWKTENPTDNLLSGDKRRSISPRGLIADHKRLVDELAPHLTDYLILIPIYNEEFWTIRERGQQSIKREPISKLLKEAFKNGWSSETIEFLLKWLYVERCNLVHGQKDY